MSEAPSIRSSAQARLLIYKLIKGKITDIERRLLESDPVLWLRVLDMLEHKLSSNGHSQSDQIALSQAFIHIERASKKGLQRQMLFLTGKEIWIGSHSADLLYAFIAEHSQLIKSVQREQLDKISLAINRGIREGRLLKELTKDIQATSDLSKRRAQLIARNAPLQYSGALTKHHQQSAGIKQYRWQTSQDERVRDSHRNRNGTAYDWNEPGPHPRSEVNCRCDAVPILD
jgi:SPP1 gp7 family putative phage head morphogenesis protein